MGAPVKSDELAFREIFDYVTHAKSIRTVILNGYWHHRLDKKTAAEFKHELETMVYLLMESGKTVYFANDVPDFGFNPGRCRATRIFSPYDPVCTQPLNEEWSNKQQILNSVMSAVSNETGAHFLNTAQYFQKEGQLFMADDEHLFYRDDDHLGINGSYYVAQQLLRSGALLGIVQEKLILGE